MANEGGTERRGSPGQPGREIVSILVVGGEGAAGGLDLRGARTLALPMPRAVGGALPGSVAQSDIVVLRLGEEGFTPAARQLCLLAWYMHNDMPIVTTAPGQADAAEAVARYARELGSTQPPGIAADSDLARAVAQAVARRAETRAAAPLRLSITSRQSQDGALAGVLVAGTAERGHQVVVLPQATPAVVQSVETQGEIGDVTGGGAQLAVRLDRAVQAEPGQILAAADARPEHADQVAAHIAWLGDQAMLPGRPYRLSLGGQSTSAQIGALKHKINPAGLDPIAARQLNSGEVGLCNVSFAAPLVFDQAPPGRQTGEGLSRFTIQDAATGEILGIGQILFTLRRATNIHWQALAIDKTARAALKEQRPCCLWFTGLSGSGKSTVASLLEKRLNAARRHTYTLDGDNVRHGLNRDLGFTDADRVENIRRVAEVSKLLVDAGLIVMVSFISPFRAERDMARALFPAGEFLEIYVDAPIDVCEGRDAKGLYKKARSGQLKNFTGIDSPYEAPERAELRLDSGGLPPEALVEQILRELARRGMVDLDA